MLAPITDQAGKKRQGKRVCVGLKLAFELSQDTSANSGNLVYQVYQAGG